MGQAKKRGTYEQRKASPMGAPARMAHPTTTLIHVSKPLVTIINPATNMPQLAVTRAPGVTRTVDGAIQRARRDRRSRVTTARQQRKVRKIYNREVRAEAEFDRRLAEHEENMDWQEEESQNWRDRVSTDSSPFEGAQA